MNREEAYRILGARIGDSQKTIKEKYRSLITQVHPDVQPEKDKIGNYSAQEINAAYTLLIRKGEWVRAEEIKGRASTGAYTYSYRSANQHSSWNEPVNPLAYLDRNVYQYAEDADGERFGMITVARGKYYWNPEEEEFPLFLMSLKDSIVERTGRKDTLLEREIMQKHSEIMYLLAQEFIDYAVCLDNMLRIEMVEDEEETIYYASAMLELSVMQRNKKNVFYPGKNLYPGRIKDHKLYLMDAEGTEQGYLSFQDDRLYYVLFPLFERRKVQIRIRIAENKKTKNKYIPLDLWVRLKAGLDLEKDGETMLLNEKIRVLLQEFHGKK